MGDPGIVDQHVQTTRYAGDARSSADDEALVSEITRKIARTSSGLPASPGTFVQVPPRVRISCSRESSLSRDFRQFIKTWYPACAKARAQARPMPREEPVTRTFFLCIAMPPGKFLRSPGLVFPCRTCMERRLEPGDTLWEYYITEAGAVP